MNTLIVKSLEQVTTDIRNEINTSYDDSYESILNPLLFDVIVWRWDEASRLMYD